MAIAAAYPFRLPRPISRKPAGVIVRRVLIVMLPRTSVFTCANHELVQHQVIEHRRSRACTFRPACTRRDYRPARQALAVGPR